jgi:hypothetical protein
VATNCVKIFGRAFELVGADRCKALENEIGRRARWENLWESGQKSQQMTGATREGVLLPMTAGQSTRRFWEGVPTRKSRSMYGNSA